MTGLAHSSKYRLMPAAVFVLVTLWVVSPTLFWSFHMDDIDYLSRMSTLRSAGDAWRFVFQIGQGQWTPLMFGLHLLSYHWFGLNPLFFHGVLTLCYLAAGLFFAGILTRLNGHRDIAYGCIAMVFWTAGYGGVLETAFSHFVLGLPFQLGALYYFHRYIAERRTALLLTCAGMAFLTPFVSGLGLLTGVWLVLYAMLCVPGAGKRLTERLRPLALPFSFWLAAFLLFIVRVRPQRFIEDPIAYLQTALILTAKGVGLYTIPLMTPWPAISWGIFVVLIATGLWFRRRIPAGPAVFFGLWMTGNFLFLYIGRGQWAERLIFSQRYGFLPALGLAGIYALIIGAVFQRIRWKPPLKPAITAVAILFLAAMAWAHHLGFINMSRYKPDLRVLGHEFQNAMAGYSHQAQKEFVTLEDRDVRPEGLFPHFRPLSQYASFLLTPEQRAAIRWESDSEANGFAAYLHRHKDKFPALYRLFESGGYFNE